MQQKVSAICDRSREVCAVVLMKWQRTILQNRRRQCWEAGWLWPEIELCCKSCNSINGSWTTIYRALEKSSRIFFYPAAQSAAINLLKSLLTQCQEKKIWYRIESKCHHMWLKARQPLNNRRISFSLFLVTLEKWSVWKLLHGQTLEKCKCFPNFISWYLLELVNLLTSYILDRLFHNLLFIGNKFLNNTFNKII